MSNPRFVWLLPCEREQYPDLPEVPHDGSLVLWDRQFQEPVAAVEGRYAQAVVFATKADDPFEHLASWFNGLTNDSWESEGMPPTDPEFTN